VNDWLIYRGTAEPHDGIKRLPPPPNWRTFHGQPLVGPPSSKDDSLERRLGELRRATTYRASAEEIDLVNAALYLRRPLLVTGKPGTGKSTLSYSVAHELGMGRVLKWVITSRSTREDGLYQYDALARLQDASRTARRADVHQYDGSDDLGYDNVAEDSDHSAYRDIGRYIRLGPLGTALLPYERPRMLLIDELDKSDIDLPNDLLAIFEDGQYEIRELSRIADQQPEATVLTDNGDKVVIRGGKIECNAFPMVMITSNGEREFPPAFKRRCLRLHIDVPDEDRLLDIVQAHLGALGAEEIQRMIETFVHRRSQGDLATDQLLNAIYLLFNEAWPEGRERLVEKVMQFISENAD
jgi:MoxR-like ATPase